MKDKRDLQEGQVCPRCKKPVDPTHAGIIRVYCALRSRNEKLEQVVEAARAYSAAHDWVRVEVNSTADGGKYIKASATLMRFLDELDKEG